MGIQILCSHLLHVVVQFVIFDCLVKIKRFTIKILRFKKYEVLVKQI
jgi:hypothetical protein